MQSLKLSGRYFRSSYESFRMLYSSFMRLSHVTFFLPFPSATYSPFGFCPKIFWNLSFANSTQ